MQEEDRAEYDERVERRLVEETSKLRLEIVQHGADLREEMAQQGVELRQEMHAGFSDLRKEMYGGATGLREEMHSGFCVVHRSAADNRVELLKWAFVFWVGQLVSVGGLVALLLRGGRGP